MFFLSSSATSSLNEANESSEDNNLTAPLISKSATFASTFLANDKFVRIRHSRSFWDRVGHDHLVILLAISR
jgi:hypothetical protein